MKILAFSDFHGSLKAIRKATRVIREKRSDLVLIAGDVTQGNLKRAQHLLRLLSEPNIPVFFVPGNVDDPTLLSWRDMNLLFGLHGRSLVFRDVLFVGLGGSPVTPFNTPFEYDESEAEELLQRTLAQKGSQRWILISHSPPINSKVDRTWAGEHVGSIAVRNIMEQKKPILVVCGHIHESRGTDEIGEVPVVNVGPAVHDIYVILTINSRVQIERMSM